MDTVGPTTRCKMRCSGINIGGYLSSEGTKILTPTVSLMAVKDDDPESENRKFWTATPSGQVTLQINNPAGAEVFEVAEEYYVDFTKVARGEHDDA